MNRRTEKIYIAAVGAMLAVCTVVLLTCFTFVGTLGNGCLCWKFVRELDLGARGVSCLDGIEKLERLEKLDMRAVEITAEQLDEIESVLPGCEVLWSVRTPSQTIDSSSTNIVCSDLAAGQVELIARMPRLESADLRGSDCYEQLYGLYRDLPECDIVYDVAIGDGRRESDTSELTLQQEHIDGLANARWLPELVRLDVSGCRDYDEITALREAMPECDIEWDGELAGVRFTGKDTLLDLSGRDVGDYDSFVEAVKLIEHFPALEKVDMCGCGFTNEQMSALNDAYPDVKFVWMIHIGWKYQWDLRTDITCFSTLMSSPELGATQEHFADLFMYCTDLVALDLGHNHISDISMIANLKKLQVLILTDNDIVDITPLAELKHLKFLEMNMNEVENLDALGQLDELEYVHMHWNNITDASALIGRTQLVRVLLSENPLTREQRDELVEALPDTTFVYVSTVASRRVWSELPIRSAAKKAFKNWQSVENFISWDNVIYK